MTNNEKSIAFLLSSQSNIENSGTEEEINEDNFHIPSEEEYVTSSEVYYEDSEIEDWDISIAKPGLWTNIQKKKKKEGKNYKPAKRGDPDRPSKEAWKLAQSSESYSDGQMQKEQMHKMHEQFEEIADKIDYVVFEEWTKDMISKAEIYIQNIYDFIKSESRIKYDTPDISTSEEYQGRNVKLGKPFRTPDGPKKFSVYVKNDKGNVVKVNFGDPNMEIKRDDPERRKSFRARHHCDTDPGPRWKARYWSCRNW